MERDSSNIEEHKYTTSAENEHRHLEESKENYIKLISELDEAIPQFCENAADDRGIDVKVFKDIFDIYLKLDQHENADRHFGNYDRGKDLLSDDDLISLKDAFRKLSGQDYKFGCAADLNKLLYLSKNKESYERIIINLQDQIDNTDWNGASLSEKKSDLFGRLGFKVTTIAQGKTAQDSNGTFMIEEIKTPEELDSDAFIARKKLAELYNSKHINSEEFKYLSAALFEVVNEAKNNL